MTRYQLAKIVEMAGGVVATRKSLQKIVFMLKAVDCPLDVAYRLHYYGPYSRDLADLVNAMTNDQTLLESVSYNAAGQQYSYRLGEKTAEGMKQWEATPFGQRKAEEMEPFRARIKDWLSRPLREIELAATILYYKKEMGEDWDQAVRDACDFKAEAESSPSMSKAIELARRAAPIS